MQQHKRAIPISDLLYHIDMTNQVLGMVDKALAGHNQDNRQVAALRRAVGSAIEHSNRILSQEPQ